MAFVLRRSNSRRMKIIARVKREMIGSDDDCLDYRRNPGRCDSDFGSRFPVRLRVCSAGVAERDTHGPPKTSSGRKDRAELEES
jgi:hypothetical protein